MRSLPFLRLAMATALALPLLVTAAVTTDIIADQATANGSVDFTITDTNTGIKVKVSAAGILATDTPAQKAAKISAAATAQINADGPPIDGVFAAAAAGNTVTITKTGGGGMNVAITGDTTGEGNKLRTKDGGGNGEHWFWRFVRWVVASSDPVVPPGDSYLLATTNGLQAIAVGDGTKTASQLQAEITAQLIAQGVSFTAGVDLATDQAYLASQYFPVGQFFPAGGVGLDSSPGYATYFGGIGVELVRIPEPHGLALLGAALVGLLLRRRHPKMPSRQSSTQGELQ